MNPPTQMFVSGAFCDAASGRRTALINPATETAFTDVAAAEVSDVNDAVEAAHRAWESGWRDLTPGKRTEILFAVARALRENLESIAQLETANIGKPISDARDEAALGARVFEYYAGAITKFGGQTIPVARGGFDFTLRQPMGVVAAIVPWNFPFPIACWKAAPALAAGNCVVLKPASLSPLTALRLGRDRSRGRSASRRAPGFAWPGSTVGDALVTHPLVRKISFTGSTDVGRRIMEHGRPGFEARVARTGWQVAQHRLCRCQLAAGRRDFADERVRQHRPGLLRAQPNVRGAQHLRTVRGKVCRGHAKANRGRSGPTGNANRSPRLGGAT